MSTTCKAFAGISCGWVAGYGKQGLRSMLHLCMVHHILRVSWSGINEAWTILCGSSTILVQV